MTADIDRMAEIANNWTAADIGSRSILLSWYKQQTGQAPDCFGCPGKMEALGRQINQYISGIKSNGMTPTTDWKLKKNSLYPMSFGSSEFISNANMSEKRAVRYLTENPNRIKVFEKYPSDWKQRIGIEPPMAEVTDAPKRTRKPKQQ